MILMRMLNFIFGYHIFECDMSDTEKLINMFMHYRIIYWDLKKCEDRTRFCILSKDAKMLSSLCASNGVCLYLADVRGLFHMLKRYKRRFGFIVGVLFIAVSVWWAGCFVWRIDVVGNESVSSREVIALLESFGLRVGSYIPSLDLDVIKNRALIESNELSWMAVNINGTSVNVIVREIENVENNEKSPANLVASCDGVIEMLEVHKGQPTVNVGDTVRNGDLLVSGIIANENAPTRYVNASGKIYARTTKHIRIEVPLEYEGKVYTGKIKKEKIIKFFGKSINLFTNTGNLSENYDKIEKEEQLSFFGRFSVPVSMVTRDFSEYTMCTLKRTELEAVKLAHAQLLLRIDDALSNAELLKKAVSARFEKEVYVIDCELCCVENIAIEAEFGIE